MAVSSPRVARASATALSLVCAVLLTACSAAYRLELSRAEALERANRPAAALAIYDTVRPLVSQNNRALISKIELRRGMCLWRLDRPADAFAAYLKSVDADPSNSAARLKLSEVYLAGNAPENALENALPVLRADEHNAEAHAVAGAAYLASGKLREAEQSFKRALQLDANAVHVALALAEVYDRQDRTNEARDVLTRAAAAVPGRADAWLALGRLEEQEGNNPAAEQAYRSAVKADNSAESNLRLAQFLQRSARVGEAEEILRRVDTMQPASPTALPDYELMAGRADRASQHYVSVLDGSSLSKSGQPAADEAVRGAIVARLIESDLAEADASSGAGRVPHNSSFARNPSGGAEFPSDAPDVLSPIARAKRHLDQYRPLLDAASIGVLESEIALAQGDLVLAGMRAEGAVVVAPDSAAAHYVLGEVRYRSGEHAGAREQWLAALQSSPDYVPAQLAMAEFSLQQDAPHDAEEFVVPVVRQEPANLRALVLYARALAAEKRFDAAESIARRALAVDRMASSAHLVLGQLALQQQHLAGALLEFEQAVLLQPRAADAIEGLTRVYRFGKITRPMLLRMEAVADREPRSATLMEITGRLFADGGWYADAERCLRRTLELDSTRVTASEALGRVYAATGALDHAAEMMAALRPESAALMEGLRAQDRGDRSAAVEHYEFAVRHGDRSGVAANNLAWIYAEQGNRLDRALALAHSAHDLLPQDPAVLDTLGIVHMARREYSQCVDALELARRMLAREGLGRERPQLAAQINQHLAQAYLRAGRSDAAAKLATSR